MKRIVEISLVLAITILLVSSNFVTVSAKDIAPDDLPLGKFVFHTNKDGNWEIYTAEWDSNGVYNLQRLSYYSGNDLIPQWSPDGTKIAYVRGQTDASELWIIDYDGINPPNYPGRRIYHYWRTGPFSWSSDGSTIAFERGGGGGDDADIYLIPYDNELEEATRLTWLCGADGGPGWSPDDQYIAYEGTGGVCSQYGWDRFLRLYSFETDTHWFIINNESGEKIEGGLNGGVKWSPVDNRLAYIRTQDRSSYLYTLDLKSIILDQTGQFILGYDVKLIHYSATPVYLGGWSLDGTMIYYGERRVATDAGSANLCWIDSTGVGTPLCTNGIPGFGGIVDFHEIPNEPPVVDADGPYSGNEGEQINILGTATDQNDDPITIEWTYSAKSGIDQNTSCSFADPYALSTQFTCNDDGEFELILTASDGINDPVNSPPTRVDIYNSNPDILSITAPFVPIEIGTLITTSGAFTDPGSNDTHTATWDWGDDVTSAGVVIGYDIAGEHIYTTPGVYTLTLTLTDDDGGSDTDYYQYIVVYDPEGGFVTGGGWINSPAGAYYPEPDLTGKATFGFVAKYKKGADVPTGNTEFQFKVADLNFKSTAYQWLVVAGKKAMYKGTGTINGDGEYGFMLSAIDGDLAGDGIDRFRIKIWDKASGDVVYDNMIDAAEDADPTTALGGGSIVIHK